MKKLIVGVVLSVMSLGVSAQSTQFWKTKGGKFMVVPRVKATH